MKRGIADDNDDSDSDGPSHSKRQRLRAIDDMFSTVIHNRWHLQFERAWECALPATKPATKPADTPALWGVYELQNSQANLILVGGTIFTVNRPLMSLFRGLRTGAFVESTDSLMEWCRQRGVASVAHGRSAALFMRLLRTLCGQPLPREPAELEVGGAAWPHEGSGGA
jgi:hypothetical protein